MSDVILGALIALLGVILGQLIMFRLQKQSNEAAMARERLRIEAQDVSDSRELILDRLDDLLTAGDKAYRALVKGDDHKKASDMFYRAMRMHDRLASVVPVFLVPAIKEYINSMTWMWLELVNPENLKLRTGVNPSADYEEKKERMINTIRALVAPQLSNPHRIPNWAIGDLIREEE